ncbi:MAG: hypothetical protein JST79_00785 [Acidobacteria bacterium]|nr:hypothetical protein [Acidobacteriota bacterium]
MAPIWDPAEADMNVYEDVHKHSDGLISFTYKPMTDADLEALKNSETYRRLVKQEDSPPEKP